MNEEKLTLAEQVVKYVATHMERESRLLFGPHAQIFMHNPYGLLDLIRDSGVEETAIDCWMVEAQEEAANKGVTENALSTD